MAEAAAIDPNRPTRIVGVAYLLATVCVGVFLENALAKIFDSFRINDPSLIGDAWRVSSLVAYVAAIVIAVVTYLNPRVNALSFEVAVELKKVSWPSAEDTRTNTIAVILFSVVASMILGVFDIMSSKIMTQWIPDALTWLSRHV